ncbi:MAG: hypothetical protein MJ025_04410 [Victivallaceae bacterium]|nr:hypothetical protein [Victivallaceae bacterium]
MKTARKKFVADMSANVPANDLSENRIYVNSTWSLEKLPEHYNGDQLVWNVNAFSCTTDFTISVDDDKSYTIVFLDSAEGTLGVETDRLFDDKHVTRYASQVFTATIVNSTDYSGTLTSSVRKTNFKAKGTMVANGADAGIEGDAISFVGFAKLSISDSRAPISISGGNLSVSVTKESLFDSDYKTGNMLSTDEKISAKRSASGTLYVSSSRIDEIVPSLPSVEKYTIAGDAVIGSDFNSPISDICATEGLDDVLASGVSYANITIVNSKVATALEGSARSFSAKLGAVAASSLSQGSSSLSLKSERKVSAKLKGDDSEFTALDGFSKLEIYSGKFDSASGGNKKTTISFKSTDDRAGIESGSPSAEQQEMISAIMSGDYVEKYVATQEGEHNISNSLSDSNKANGSVLLQGGAIGSQIDGFKSVTLKSSTVGPLDALSHTLDKKSSSVRKGMNLTVSYSTKSADTASGTLKANNSVIGGAVTGFANIDISYDFDRDADYVMQSVVCRSHQDETSQVSKQTAVLMFKSDKTSSKDNVVGKVKISTNATRVGTRLAGIEAKDIELFGNVYVSDGMTAGSRADSAEEKNTATIGLKQTKTNTSKHSLSADGKLAYTGSGTVAGAMAGFSKISLDGVTFDGSIDSSGYSTGMTKSTSWELKKSGEKIDSSSAKTSNSHVSNGTLTLGGCTIGSDGDIAARGIKSATISWLHNDSGHGFSLVGGNITNKQDLSTVTTSLGTNVTGITIRSSGSQTVAAAGSAKISDSSIKSISGIDKLELVDVEVQDLQRRVFDDEAGEFCDCSKQTFKSTTKTDKYGVVTQDDIDTDTHIRGGSLKMVGGNVSNGIYGFDSVQLAGSSTSIAGGIANCTMSSSKTTTSTTWNNVNAYVGGTAAFTQTTKTDVYKASGKLVASVGSISGGISGFDKVDIGGSVLGKVDIGGDILAGQTTTTEYSDNLFTDDFQSNETRIDTSGSLNLRYADVHDDIIQFKTVSLSGVNVAGDILGGGTVTTERTVAVFNGGGRYIFLDDDDLGSHTCESGLASAGADAYVVDGADYAIDVFKPVLPIKTPGIPVYPIYPVYPIGPIVPVFPSHGEITYELVTDTVCRNSGTLTLSSAQEKGSETVTGTTVSGTVSRFETVNMTGGDVRVMNIGNVGKINAKGVATIDNIVVDNTDGSVTAVNVTGAGASLTMNHAELHAGTASLNVGSGAFFKLCGGLDVASGDSLNVTISGEACADTLIGKISTANCKLKGKGKISTSNRDVLTGMGAYLENKGKIFFIGEGDEFFKAYKGELFENADNTILGATQLAVDENGKFTGWLSDRDSCYLQDFGTVSCIVDSVDFFKVAGGEFATLEFEPEKVVVYYSSDGLSFNDWFSATDGEKADFLAGGGYLDISMVQSDSMAPITYSISGTKA